VAPADQLKEAPEEIDVADAAAGIVIPNAIIGKPFPPPQPDTRYFLDDGLILRC